jgi:hypothetical protein
VLPKPDETARTSGEVHSAFAENGGFRAQASVGLFRHRRWKAGGAVELTWYPTDKRDAPRPLLQISRIRKHGRVRAHLRVCIHRGYMYELQIGRAFHRWRHPW